MANKVTVEATEERYRALCHQPSGLPFDENGRAEWPVDQFLYRLIAEGSVRIVEADDKSSPPKPADKPSPDPKKN